MFALVYALLEIGDLMDGDGPDVDLRTSFHADEDACKSGLIMSLISQCGPDDESTPTSEAAYADLLLEDNSVDDPSEFLDLSFEEKVEFIIDMSFGGEEMGVSIKYQITEVPTSL